MSFLYQRLFNRSYPLEREMALRFTEQRAFNVTNVLAEIKVGTGVEGCRQALRMMQAASRQHQFQLLLFGAMGKEIQQLCQELGVPYYNIEAKIPKQLYPADYALFFMHPAPPGHRVLADYLERELAGRGWLKPRVPRPATPGA